MDPPQRGAARAGTCVVGKQIAAYRIDRKGLRAGEIGSNGIHCGGRRIDLDDSAGVGRPARRFEASVEVTALVENQAAKGLTDVAHQRAGGAHDSSTRWELVQVPIGLIAYIQILRGIPRHPVGTCAGRLYPSKQEALREKIRWHTAAARIPVRRSG